MRPDRRERGLAPRPKDEALLLAPSTRGSSRRRWALGDRGDALDEQIDLDGRAVELDDQQRLDVERIAGADERLGRMDRRPIHHLHAARNDAVADDRGDGCARVLDRGEADQQRARGLRARAESAR